MLHLTVASAAFKNQAKSIEEPLDLNETRSKRLLAASTGERGARQFNRPLFDYPFFWNLRRCELPVSASREAPICEAVVFV